MANRPYIIGFFSDPLLTIPFGIGKPSIFTLRYQILTKFPVKLPEISSDKNTVNFNFLMEEAEAGSAAVGW